MHDVIDQLACWFIRLISAVVQKIPLETAFRWARNLSLVAYYTSKRRRVAYTNLKAAFPESTAQKRTRWAREMFQNLGMNAIEIMRFPVLTREDIAQHVTTHGDDVMLEHWKNADKGLIFLTAHVGNWEFSQVVEGLRGRPLTVLARRQKFQRLDRLLNSFREFHGAVSVHKGGGVRDLIRTLRQAGCVGMLGDQAGGDNTVWVRFFGRLVNAPRGPVALALKLNATLMPVFMVRRKDDPFHHDLIFNPPMKLFRSNDLEKDIQINMQNYIHILETYLTENPSQWLWGHKRWKRTRTKRVLVLSDGKPGHEKQSITVAKSLAARAHEKTPPYEIITEKIDVEFKNSWRRTLFPFFALFFIPFAQGRLQGLRFFLRRESLEKIERTNPDVIISTGSSLTPLNLILAKENLAKSVVIMKPSFPFNLFRYDLALIPAHDRGLVPRENFRIQGSLSEVDTDMLEVSRDLLGRGLQYPHLVRFSLFLGGETRNFKPIPSDVENILKELEKASAASNGFYLVTTSRRTPEAVNRFLRERIKDFPRCQLSVIATEDHRAEVVPGMMALAEALIVTEDSLSMITEALSSGKKVVVVKMGRPGLSQKHYRFHKQLETNWDVPVVEIARLSEILSSGSERQTYEHFKEERVKISEKLETLL